MLIKYMKRITLSICLLLVVNSIIAQKKLPDNSIQTLSKLELGFQGIGYGYETALGKNTSIDFSAGLGGGYEIYNTEIAYGWSLFEPSLYFSVTPKLYYNRQRRLEKGRSIAFNSGNYFGIRLRVTSPSINPDYGTRFSSLMNMHWGLQRPVGSKWLFNTHIGLGVARDLTFKYQLIYPAFDLKFSYLFNHRKLSN
jgi:hypothetical protein